MIYILLPAYNEERNLIKIFKKIEKLPHARTNISVVLVDDFSTDNTSQLLKKKYKFKLSYIRHKKNKGSDNTHPISVIDKMVKKINDSNDIVVASRFAPGSEVNGVSTWRHFLSTGAKFLFKFLYPFRNLNDYTCNFRAYKTELIKELLRNKTFFKNEDFNIAGKIILFLTNRFKHLKLAEVPFKLSYDYKIGDSKMNLTKTIILTLDLIFNGTHK